MSLMEVSLPARFWCTPGLAFDKCVEWKIREDEAKEWGELNVPLLLKTQAYKL